MHFPGIVACHTTRQSCNTGLLSNTLCSSLTSFSCITSLSFLSLFTLSLLHISYAYKMIYVGFNSTVSAMTDGSLQLKWVPSPQLKNKKWVLLLPFHSTSTFNSCCQGSTLALSLKEKTREEIDHVEMSFWCSVCVIFFLSHFLHSPELPMDLFVHCQE